MSGKIIDADELGRRARQLREAGKKLVMTNGCFDLVHVGHVRYLEAARALGDALVVGVNGDSSVRELKGAGRPINNERDRAEVLAALGCVDFVTVFHDKRATQLLEKVAPSIYVKGGDYSEETLDAEERTVLKDAGAEIRIIPLVPGYSTSVLLEKLRTL
jgi:rfaE bifunctional protein nucleotidyltransferase chain/domain